MTNAAAAKLGALAMLTGLVVACSRESESPTPAQKSTGSAELSVTFKVDPDPPQAGNNRLEVLLAQSGAPVTDATVTAVFYMPPMPSMNMPEMRSIFALQPAGGGLYRGSGTLSMNGTWIVTVAASRGATQIGSRKFTVIAK